MMPFVFQKAHTGHRGGRLLWGSVGWRDRDDLPSQHHSPAPTTFPAIHRSRSLTDLCSNPTFAPDLPVDVGK